MSREPFDAATVPAPGGANIVTGNETTPRRGRPRLHADSAAKARAYRNKAARLDVAIKPAIAQTIASIAGELDCSSNELVNSLIRFALTNRNWRQQGLWGSSRTGAAQ